MNRDRLSLPMFVALAFAGATTLWLGWRHIGPYRWLAEAEASMLGGSYHPQIIGLLLFLVIAGPLALIARAIPVGPALELSRINAYTGMYPRHMQLTMLCVMGLGVGGVLFVRMSLAGPLVTTSLEAFEAAEEPPAYVRLQGFEAVVEDTVRVSSSRNYVPLRPTRGGLIEVLAEVNDEELSALATSGAVEGLVDEDGLPNEVRVLYEDAQLLADPYYVIEVGSSPESGRSFALYLLAFASALGVLLLVYYFANIAGNL